MLGKDCQHVQRDFEAKEQLPSVQCDEEPMNRYEILADLGGGAYGTVYKAKDKDEDKIVALKKISVREDPEIPGYPPFVVREVANLRRLSSDKHIVRYVHACMCECAFTVWRCIRAERVAVDEQRLLALIGKPRKFLVQP